MREARFPTLEETLYLLEELIRRFGGAPGVRDQGLLESALARPKSGYYKSLSEQAAALMHSLVLNHSFVDGNKRVAFALTAVFLLMNGHSLKVDPDEGEAFVLAMVRSSKQPLAVITEWLEKRMVPVTQLRSGRKSK